MNELKIPDAAKHDPNASEILRMWLADGGQHVALKTDPAQDPARWGLILAELAQQVAKSYAAQGKDRDQTLIRILQGLKAEFENTTDVLGGALED